MKDPGIEVRIGRLVVDAPQRGETAGLADAIGAALHARLVQSSATVEAANTRSAPQAIADRIATQLTTTVPRFGMTARGKP
ncbi:hypothetical protein [Bradyrhizobium sp. OK095]|uniref:hypothetical protein n=1 Tax=Bradyrhizobium sp. OK095 TaxID=1882760 RepID=UPI0008AFA7AB|nr:hypothetical protein [Bradyrhizobium sp. OK095]SEM27760.1 hypothetical protein SAMN05443254_101546 [Bradyrhizobium sp. OK095]